MCPAQPPRHTKRPFSPLLEAGVLCKLRRGTHGRWRRQRRAGRPGQGRVRVVSVPVQGTTAPVAGVTVDQEVWRRGPSAAPRIYTLWHAWHGCSLQSVTVLMGRPRPESRHQTHRATQGYAR